MFFASNFSLRNWTAVIEFRTLQYVLLGFRVNNSLYSSNTSDDLYLVALFTAEFLDKIVQLHDMSLTSCR